MVRRDPGVGGTLGDQSREVTDRFLLHCSE
jgi:hypothetical protein